MQKAKMISYNDYIQEVLYHPVYGYYNKNEDKVGSRGDFYTSSNVGDIFGRTLANWFVHIITTYQLPACIVELGGGTGRLAHAILQEINEKHPEVFHQLHYIIVESSHYHQQQQKQLLADNSQVYYYNNLDHLSSIRGIVISNELFDAFPVHVIENKDHQLFEAMITVDNDVLKESLVPLENSRIFDYLCGQKLILKDGQRLEIPIAMIDFYRSLCRKVEKGMIVTIDYGYLHKEWGEASHRKGSLRGYYQHKMIENVLLYSGNMDITSHIHWDALQSVGMEENVKTEGLFAQNDFLISCGILSYLQNSSSTDPFSFGQKRNRAIRTLIQPGQISSYFKTLIQAKRLDIDHLFPLRNDLI